MKPRLGLRRATSRTRRFDLIQPPDSVQPGVVFPHVETRSGKPQRESEMIARSDCPTPLVTIGLPVFNASQYLRECLVSLVEQTYSNIRIVISDNASTDDTVAICEEFAA